MNHIVSQLLTTHETLSTHGSHFIFLFPCPTLIALLILPKSLTPLRIGFAWGFVLDLLVLALFVLDFCFSDLFFFWWEVGVIFFFCIFVSVPLFCEFLDFLHFREILVLVRLCRVLSI